MQEMALKNTSLVGDFDKDGSFADTDRKIHLGKNRVSQLKNFFKNTEVDFNIVFLNCKGKPTSPSIINGIGLERKEDLFRHLNWSDYYNVDSYTFDLITEQFSESDINVIMTHNEGDQKVPMSPWIVAHRISHALANLYKSSYDQDYGDTFIPLMRKVFLAIYGNSMTDYNPTMWLDSLANQIGTMHSTTAKKMAVYRGGEFYHELFAQYICSGKVTLKRNVFETIDLPIGDTFPVVQDNMEVVASVISKTEKKLNILFKEALEEAKGKYYVL
jgi:dihydrofolate reductase